MANKQSVIYGDYFFYFHIHLWQILVAIILIIALIYLIKRKRVV
jgi:uncharacterized membrane protein YgaE (UPF0421/DUF939 family)